jgi:PAS domain S-box-containing protein
LSWLAGVGVALLALGLWAGARRSRGRAERFWALAWCSTLVSGALVLLAPSPPTTALIAFLGPVFPAGQLAGALAFAPGRAPAWIVPSALALGLVRAASVAWGFTPLVSWIPLGVEPAGTLVAAWLLHRAARRDGAPWMLSVLPALLVVAAGCDLATAVSRVATQGAPVWLAVTWLALAISCLPLQLHLALNRDRHQLANLQFRTEAELEQSQARFRAIAESGFDLIAELDGDERFTYVNPRYEEVLGYPRAEMVGRWPIDFLHPDDVEAGLSFAAAADTGDVAESVVRARRSDGSWIWLENVARSYVAPDGQRRWVMNSRDVSERMAREEMRDLDHARLALSAAESEDRFRVLTDQAPELIAEFDAGGRCTFANARFLELLGLDPKVLIGSTPEPILHPDDFPVAQAALSRGLHSDERTHGFYRMRHVDGSWRWFEQTGRAYRSSSGALRFVSIARDVTEVRRQEAERRELDERMREVQRLDSLGALAGGIAHDFNNLLAVILGNVRLLEDAGLGESAQRRLRRIHAAAAHAEALTDQMLTYAGRSVTELAPLDLSKLVSDTEDLLRATVADRGRLTLELDLELADAPLIVRGDATQLRQVMLNLVANASEAMAGGSRGRVRVRTALLELDAAELADGVGATERPPGAWVLLEVADDGPGMPAALRERIFEPFFTTRTTGRGLGLSAVLGIATAHGGVLQLDSAPGLGTAFRLLLRPARAHPQAARPDPAVEAGPSRDARILVVDDDEAVREVAQMLLERVGYRVTAAAGAEDALASLAGGEEVDAVLLDLEMPSVSGAELAGRIRRVRPDLPIVIASGYKRDLATERLGPETTAGFVQKPFDPDSLLAAIDTALLARETPAAPAAG